jgi:hypothetical protein
MDDEEDHVRAVPLLSSGATTSAGLGWLGSGRRDCQHQDTPGRLPLPGTWARVRPLGY